MCVCVYIAIQIKTTKSPPREKKKKKKAAYPGQPMIRTDPKTCSRAAAQRNSQTH